MKLKATETGVKEKNSKRGRSSKNKGANYERDIAKKFQSKYGIELKRTPQSGGFSKKSEKADDFRGDITIVDTKQMLKVHIECKDQKSWSLPKWIEQSESDCPEGRVPLVVFHKHGTSKDYVCLSLDDFLSIVPKDKIVGKRVFN